MIPPISSVIAYMNPGACHSNMKYPTNSNVLIGGVLNFVRRSSSRYGAMIQNPSAGGTGIRFRMTDKNCKKHIDATNFCAVVHIAGSDLGGIHPNCGNSG